MKQIPLTQGKFAIVDDEDFEWLSQWKWSAQYISRNWYAVRRESVAGTGKKNGRYLLMHRVILGKACGVRTDHRNGNGLDNRRENLRPATARQNNQNQTRKQLTRGGVKCSSKFKGVHWDKDRGKWFAQIATPFGKKALGRYSTEEKAAEVYNKAVHEYHGEFAAMWVQL